MLLGVMPILDIVRGDIIKLVLADGLIGNLLN